MKNIPAVLRPLLYLYVRLNALAAKVKRKFNDLIDWILNKIVTWFIAYYMRKLELA